MSNTYVGLNKAETGKEYKIVKVSTDDEEMKDFLFTLGCYEGEPIVVVSHLSGGYVISVKDGRYNINEDLAEVICVEL